MESGIIFSFPLKGGTPWHRIRYAMMVVLRGMGGLFCLPNCWSALLPSSFLPPCPKPRRHCSSSPSLLRRFPALRNFRVDSKVFLAPPGGGGEEEVDNFICIGGKKGRRLALQQCSSYTSRLFEGRGSLALSFFCWRKGVEGRGVTIG